MSKQKIIQNNIEFLVDNVGGYLLPAKLTLMGDNSYINYKVVNAVDIDWNEVDLGSGKISDTGLLLKEIKDLKNRPSTLKLVEKIAIDLADLLITERIRDLKDYLYNLPQCITKDPVNQFYNNVFYDDSTTASLVLNYDTNVERIIKPFPVFIISSGVNAPNVLLRLYEDSNGIKEVPYVKTGLLPGEYIDKVREREDTDYLPIFNLIPNKEYWYKADGDDPIGGSFKTSGVRRLLYIDKATNIHNFRDLGGLKAIGGTIKYGKVIRGTHIDDITETGIALLKAIGINYELDLRQASEITANDLSSQGIELINTPFITFDVAILNTDAAKTSVRTAFEAFIGALNENKNILVHCSGGKDRTGFFCFLLEALLGCSRDTIDKDYELSALYKAESFKLNLRSANTSYYNYLGFLAFLNTFDGYTLLEKVRDYLILCGITPLYLDTIKLKLILKEEFTNDDLNVAISKETEAGVALDVPSNAASLALHALDYADLAADAADLAKDYAKAVKDYLLEFSESEDIDATVAALLAENAGAIADLQTELIKTREKALGVLGNSDEDTIQYEPYKDFVKYILFTSTTNDSPDWNVTEARKATSRYLDDLAIPKGLGNANIDKYLNDPRFSSAILFTNQNRVYINANKFKNIPIGFININSWALPLLAYNIYVGASNTADDGAPNLCLNWVQIVFNGLLYKVNPSTGELMRVSDDYVPIEGEELFIGPASATYDAGIYTRVYRNNKWSAWKEYSVRKLLKAIDDVKTEIRNLDTATEDKLQKVNTSIENTLQLARRFKDYAPLTKTPVFHSGKYTTESENGVTYYNNDDMTSVTFPIGTAIQGFKNGANVTLTKELVFKWNRDTRMPANHIVETMEGGAERDVYYGDASNYVSFYIVAKKIDTSSCSLRLIPANRTVDLEEDEVVLALVRWLEDLIDYNSVRNKVTAPVINNYPLPTTGKPFRVLDIGNSFTTDATSCLALIFTNLGIDTSNLCVYIMTRGGATYKDWAQTYNNTSIPTSISIYNFVGGYKQNVTSGVYNIENAENNTWYKWGTETEVPNQLFEVLNNNVWDLVVIHHSSSTEEISLYTEGLQELISIIRRHLPLCSIGTYIIHSQASTYSTNREKSTFYKWWRNSESVKILLNLGIDIVIPYGTAIENLRTVKQEISTDYASYFSRINGNLLPFTRDGVQLTSGEIDEAISEGFAVHDLSRDGLHLGTGLARYTAACTYYLAIFAPYTGISVLSKDIQDLPTSGLTRAEYAAKSGKKYPLMNKDLNMSDAIYNLDNYTYAITDCLDVNSYNAKLAEKAAIWACGDMHNVHNPIELPISEDIKSHSFETSTSEPFTVYSDISVLYFNKSINPKTGEVIDLGNYIVTGFLGAQVRFKFTLEEKTKEVDGEIISYSADKYYIVARYIYDSNYNYRGAYSYGTEQANYSDRIIARDGDHMRFVIKAVSGNIQEGDAVFEYILNSTNTDNTIHIEHNSDEFNFPYEEEYFIDTGNATTLMANRLDCKSIYIDAKTIYADFAIRFFLQNKEGQVQIVNRAVSKRSILLTPTSWGVLYSDYKFIGFTLIHRPQSKIEEDKVDSYLSLAVDTVIPVLNFDIIQLQDSLDLLKRPEKRIYKNVAYNTATNTLEDSDKRCISSFVPVNTFIKVAENFLVNSCMAFDAEYNYLGKEVEVTVSGNTLEKATNVIKKSKYYIYQCRKVDYSIVRQNDNLSYDIQETYPENVNSIKNVSTSGNWHGITNKTGVSVIGYDSMPAFRINSKELTITVRNMGIYSRDTTESIQRPARQNNYWVLKYFYINVNNEPKLGYYVLPDIGTYTFLAKETWNSNILGFSVYCWCADAQEGYDAVIDITVSWDEAGTGQLLSSDSGTQIVSGAKINTNNRYIGAIFFDAWNNNDPYKDAHPESTISTNVNSNVNSVDNLNLHVLAPYGNTFSGGVEGFMARSLWLFELIDLDKTFEGSLYSPYPKFHLNAIKVAAGSDSGQVTSIKVVDKNNQARDLLVEDFKCWNSSQKNSVEATMPPIQIEVNTNTTVNPYDLVAGFGGVGANIYAKLTLYKKIVITGTPNLKLRLLYNRFSDENNEALLERILTISNTGSVEFKPIDDYKSSEVMPIIGYFDVYNKKVSAFKGDLVNPLSGTQEKFILRDWCDFCYDVFGETPVRLCSIVDFFASKGLTLKDSNGNSLIPISVVSNMPMESSDGVPLGWRNTNTVALLEKLIDMASDYGLDYFIFHLYTAYTFNEDNTVNREKFIMANRGLYNFLAADNSYKMKFCVSMSSSHIVAANIDKSKERTHNLIKFIYDELISKPNYLYVNGGPIICHYYGSSSITDSTLAQNLEFYKSYNKIANIKILKHNLKNNPLTGVVANGVWKYSGFPSYGVGLPYGSTYTSNATLLINYNYNVLKKDTMDGVKEIFTNIEPIEIIPVTTGYGNYNRSGGLNGNLSETPTKEEFLGALKEAIDFAETSSSEDKLVSIYAWNEFCEGGSLLPKQSEIDANIGFDKLQAVKEAKDYWRALSKTSYARITPSEESSVIPSTQNTITSLKLVGALYFGGWTAARHDTWYTDKNIWDNLISNAVLTEVGLPEKQPSDVSWLDYVYRTEGEVPPSDCSLFMYYPQLRNATSYDFLGSNITMYLDDYKNYEGINYYRKPYWGWRVDTVEDMEREIDLAYNYGIDYFAFCYYINDSMFDSEDNFIPHKVFPETIPLRDNSNELGYSSNIALLLYQLASNNYKVQYCLIPIFGKHGNGFLEGNTNIGPERSAKRVGQVLNYIYNTYIHNSSNYVKINNSPIILYYQDFNGTTGNASNISTVNQNIAQYINKLNRENVKILHNYYPLNFLEILKVDGYWRYAVGENADSKKDFKDYTLGYVNDVGNAISGTNSYSETALLRTSNLKVYPILMGYNNIVRSNFTTNTIRCLEKDIYTNYFQGIKDIMNIADNDSGDKTILIYAWNEFGEGGYLPPTEGDLVVGTPESNRPTAEFNNQTYYIDKLKAIKDAKEYWLSK